MPRLDWGKVAEALRLTDEDAVLSITNVAVLSLLVRLLASPSLTVLAGFGIAVLLYFAKKVLVLRASFAAKASAPSPVAPSDEKLAALASDLSSLKKQLDSLQSALALKSAFSK